MLCAAQASPPPVFRFVQTIYEFITITILEFGKNQTRLKQFLGHFDNFFSQQNLPKIIAWFLWNQFVSFCLSRNLNFNLNSNISEPISSTPPKMSTVDTRPVFYPSNYSFSLICPAQGYPAPSFRYFLTKLNFYFVLFRSFFCYFLILKVELTFKAIILWISCLDFFFAFILLFKLYWISLF